MEADGLRISSSEGEKYPFKEDLLDPDDYEKIIFPPSAELIADQYEHCDNKNGLLLIFHSKNDEQNTKIIIEEFTDQDYNIEDRNIFELVNKESVLQSLDEVISRGLNNYTCLIVFFMGTIESEDKFIFDDDPKSVIRLKDVWTKFTANNCPDLKTKPKVFIFQGCKRQTKIIADSVVPRGAYDVPSEADILVVYKRIQNPQIRSTFIKSLCSKIDKFGKKDDIIGLVTRTIDGVERRPLVISTLTRKFYLSSGNSRGYYYDLDNNNEKVLEELRGLQNEFQKKPKKKTFRTATVADSSKAKPQKNSTQSRPTWKF